ncbi:glycine cleavage system protein H [Tuanshanicoccus lijuaniae]|uniref:glycine cleavage system protein H n=1 Tax=Aerococcaceae bacterium zg-1292 TaxID=2774330 RepID=UPI001935D782|nr:glycine cleavage system protein H [Aerococcaceae bacterium zg-1292]QQA36667.1 glycine cleavage system protein H [Aerococcaceae bacterium zg-1292]
MRKIYQQLWIQKEEAGYRVGMTPELQDDAGDISYVNIAPLGGIEVDDTLFNVEASKAAIEIPSPLKGTIVAINEAAVDNPTLLNSTNETDNWVVLLADVDETAFLALD